MQTDVSQGESTAPLLSQESIIRLTASAELQNTRNEVWISQLQFLKKLKLQKKLHKAIIVRMGVNLDCKTKLKDLISFGIYAGHMADQEQNVRLKLI